MQTIPAVCEVHVEIGLETIVGPLSGAESRRHRVAVPVGMPEFTMEYFLRSRARQG